MTRIGEHGERRAPTFEMYHVDILVNNTLLISVTRKIILCKYFSIAMWRWRLISLILRARHARQYWRCLMLIFG
jgi:hypothetical protein